MNCQKALKFAQDRDESSLGRAEWCVLCCDALLAMKWQPEKFLCDSIIQFSLWAVGAPYCVSCRTNFNNRGSILCEIAQSDCVMSVIWGIFLSLSLMKFPRYWYSNFTAARKRWICQPEKKKNIIYSAREKWKRGERKQISSPNCRKRVERIGKNKKKHREKAREIRVNLWTVKPKKRGAYLLFQAIWRKCKLNFWNYRKWVLVGEVKLQQRKLGRTWEKFEEDSIVNIQKIRRKYNWKTSVTSSQVHLLFPPRSRLSDGRCVASNA